MNRYSENKFTLEIWFDPRGSLNDSDKLKRLSLRINGCRYTYLTPAEVRKRGIMVRSEF